MTEPKSQLLSLKEEFYKLKNKVCFLLSSKDTSKYNHIQSYLYFIHFPLFSFTESIIILCENDKTKPANVLLRVLFEAHINIIYHQLKDSDYRLAVSTKAMFDQRIKTLRELKELIQKYENLKSTNPANLLNEEYLEKAEKWNQKELQAVLRGNNLQEKIRDLDLKSKAIKCDEEFDKEIEKGHFEQMYTLVYRYLSPFSHLDIEGLQAFVKKTETGIYSFDDGDDEERLITEAIGICVAFSKDLVELNIIENQITDEVRCIESLLKNRGEKV
jgi:hypothetical protein